MPPWGESAGAGAAIVAGAGKVLKAILELDDNDLDQLGMKHTEKTDQAAYHAQNVTTQMTTQATQAMMQAVTQAPSGTELPVDNFLAPPPMQSPSEAPSTEPPSS